MTQKQCKKSPQVKLRGLDLPVGDLCLRNQSTTDPGFCEEDLMDIREVIMQELREKIDSLEAMYNLEKQSSQKWKECAGTWEIDAKKWRDLYLFSSTRGLQ